VALRWPDKDPNADKDYNLDWTARLASGETIISAVWTSSPSGLTHPVEDQSISNGVCTVWVSGGTAGTAYSLTCRITTSRGMVDDQTVTIKIVEQ